MGFCSNLEAQFSLAMFVTGDGFVFTVSYTLYTTDRSHKCKRQTFWSILMRAKDACNNAGEDDDYHFPDIRKTIPMPNGAEKEIAAITKGYLQS